MEKTFSTNSFSPSEGKPSSSFFQPRLAINQPNDIYEQEADTMAERVMRMKNDTSPDRFFRPASKFLQRKCAECEKEETIHRRESANQTPEMSNDVNSYIESLSSKGSPLPQSTRNFFESRMGYDFSQVKIHNDDVASKSAASINALAFTTGNNIVFNQNQFSPETDSGKKLLAHELTHVVQQSGSISKMIQKYDDPKKWCKQFMRMVVYEQMHGKLATMYQYNSFTFGIVGEDTLIPLNHNIPSIYGDVDVDWMLRLAFIQYPFIIASIFSPSMAKGFGMLGSTLGYLALKSFWNTVRAPADEWEWEYGSVLEEGNWNSSIAIIGWIHDGLSLADIFAPAVKLC